MSKKSLSAKHLSKHFKRKHVVQDVSLTVQEGEIVGLLGPNGAGKTTSFSMIVGMLGSDEGSIEINGVDVTDKTMVQRSRFGLGYLPQETSIFRKLSVEDNIMVVLDNRKDINKQAAKEKLESLLEEFHISHIRGSMGMSLSQGERRRVEIARALAAAPDFLLLDEPFAGVDPVSVLDIQRITRQLKDKGLGVLITDHNVRETLGLCDRAYIVNSGHIIAEGDTEAILNNEQVRSTYLGQDFVI
jgi:lipopolysaccharide export system ATP-binding protein